jgi:hypothetical protein
MFRNVILKIVPKTGYKYTLEKFTNESKGKPEQKFDAAFGTTFRISVFKEGNKNFIDFSLELSRLKILITNCACQESTDLNFIGFKTIFIW